jgi:glucose-1-phosphate adenylyltransferase
MSTERIIAFVMAGGEGSRLQPLTAARSKPAVPFGARYCLIDFVLSNLVNSGIHTIYLLVQYKSQSLIEHVRRAWRSSPLLPDQFVTVVPPQMRTGASWFQGTADAVFQNLNLIDEHAPDLVAVFGADHIYRMDISQMVAFHRTQSADVTVAAIPVPIAEARRFGVIAADDDGRVRAFQEKPSTPLPMPGDPDQVFASMGNYLFRTEVLVEALREAQRRGETDFGKHALPRLLGDRRLFAYNFLDNRIPSLKPYETPFYWRDVGTIDAYYEAHGDVLGAEPRFDLFNPAWPIFSSNYQGPVTRILGGELRNSLFGAASVIHEGCRIHNSIVRREAVVEEDVVLEDCILMDFSRIGRGSRLRRVIVDRHNPIAPGTVIGYDPAADRARFHVSEGGVVVVPAGPPNFYARPRQGASFAYS